MDILVKVCKVHYHAIQTQKNGFIKWGLYDDNFKMYYYRIDKLMKKFRPNDFVYFSMGKDIKYFAECNHIQETIFPRGIIIYFDVVMKAEHMKDYKVENEFGSMRAIYFDDGMRQLKRFFKSEEEKKSII